MLCHDCEMYRFPQLYSRTYKSKSTKQLSGKLQSQSRRKNSCQNGVAYKVYTERSWWVQRGGGSRI